MIVMPPSRIADRPIEVSYTASNRAHECELAEVRYRDGSPRRVKPRRRFLPGNVVHSCMEYVALHRSMPPNRFVYDTFVNESSKPGMEWTSPDDPRELLTKTARTVGCLAPYALQLVRAADGFCRAEIELYADIPLYPGCEPDSWESSRYPLFRMTAKIDLWATSLAGTHYVIDYKSGANRDPKQMAWYAAVWAAATRNMEPTPKGHFMFILPDLENNSVHRVKVDVSPQQMIDAIRRAREVAQFLDRLNPTPRPSMSRCKECRVRVGCPASAFRTQSGRAIGEAVA